MDLSASFIIESFLRLVPPVALASLGGLYSERSGVANLCLEGMMLAGAFAAVVGVVYTGTLIGGIACAVCSGLLLAALHATLSLVVGINQFVSGVVVNMLAAAATSFLLTSIFGVSGATRPIHKSIYLWHVDILYIALVISLSIIVILSFSIRKRTLVKKAIFLITSGLLITLLCIASFGSDRHVISISPILVISALLYIFSGWVFARSAWGVHIIACGDSQTTAISSGINTDRIRWCCVLFSGLLCGLAGAYLSIGLVGQFRNEMTMGKGFLAVGAIVLGKWRLKRTFIAACLIGSIETLQIMMQGIMPNWPSQSGQLLPYAIVLLYLFSNREKMMVPAELGKETEHIS